MVKSLLRLGDVLKTSPLDGYWGAAVVLSEREATSEFDPMCHIGITSTVIRTDYAFEDLDIASLHIIQFERGIRVDVRTYASRLERCIGIYSRRNNPLPILGRIDPSVVFNEPLEFVAGDGTDGGWPFCGVVTKSLGNEAVHEWRAKNDPDEYNREIAEAAASHEELLKRLESTNET